MLERDGRTIEIIEGMRIHTDTRSEELGEQSLRKTPDNGARDGTDV
jgi:hypothetical protein